ncbi:hypothetical protein R1flu_019387 [Riccia fluitans]|uniref:Exostosin GT47 domain-containing protein n=1 Tax=Riccia fluitans TaxID=41844 RepID=A0ABD1ZMC5_9MARC
MASSSAAGIGMMQQRGSVSPSKYSKPLSMCNQLCLLGVVMLASFALLARHAYSTSFALDDSEVDLPLGGNVDDEGLQHQLPLGGRLQLRERKQLDYSPRQTQKLQVDVDLDSIVIDSSDAPNVLQKNRPLPIKVRKKLNRYSNCVHDKGIQKALGVLSQLAYKNPKLFYEDFREMACKFKVFVYPSSNEGNFRTIFQPHEKEPTGNYASEHYFKMALINSSFVTSDPSEADLFFMPFSIVEMRNHPDIGTDGIKYFVKKYVERIREEYPYWNRTDGADHFYVNCHSIGRTATDEALHVRFNAIQVVCSSSYFLQPFYPHKDATIPQIWPRSGFPKEAESIKQRKTLAFFAGAGNSPVRAELAKYWSNDSEIKVYTSRIDTPYDQALLSSKFCLHVKGFEVNTARLGDAIFYGCVPVIIAAYHDLPFNDVLDWSQLAVVIPEADIPKMKKILKSITPSQYGQMQSNVRHVRKHFQWHASPQPLDAFHMVMYELWLRRHLIRRPLDLALD